AGVGRGRGPQRRLLDTVERTVGFHIERGYTQVAVVLQGHLDQLAQRRIQKELLPAQVHRLGLRVALTVGFTRGPDIGHRHRRSLIFGNHGTATERTQHSQTDQGTLHCAFSSVLWASRRENSEDTRTENSGTQNLTSTVAVSMPPIAPVPMAWELPAPAPLVMARGTTPRVKASEVMMIGRRRMRQASTAASTRDMPCSCRSLANSTM